MHPGKMKIMEEYKVEDGLITSPGPFEGEPVWAPYYYLFCLDGGGGEEVFDECDRQYSFFVVEMEDRKVFPELKETYGVELSFDDSGFCRTMTFSTEAAMSRRINDLIPDELEEEEEDQNADF